jgi:hypothetical protein
MRPHICPDQLGDGEVATWAPSSSTLISGPTDFPEAPGYAAAEDEAIAGVVRRPGCPGYLATL